MIFLALVQATLNLTILMGRKYWTANQNCQLSFGIFLVLQVLMNHVLLIWIVNYDNRIVLKAIFRVVHRKRCNLFSWLATDGTSLDITSRVGISIKVLWVKTLELYSRQILSQKNYDCKLFIWLAIDVPDIT